MERLPGGIRMFQDTDLEWLQITCCMKKAGMSIRDIRQYIQLAMQGDDTIDTRLQMFHHQRQVLLDQIREMQHTLETVEYKCWFYETAQKAGTCSVHKTMREEDIPERFREAREKAKGKPENADAGLPVDAAV